MEPISKPDRRRNNDRRTRATSPFTLSNLHGARTHPRRKADRTDAFYVDRYPSFLLFMTLAIIILSLADAVFTLTLINLGAREINPVMDFFLRWGPFQFLMVKYFLTSGSLIVFIIHKNFSIFGGRLTMKVILRTVLLMYLMLVIYELLLLSWIAP